MNKGKCLCNNYNINIINSRLNTGKRFVTNKPIYHLSKSSRKTISTSYASFNLSHSMTLTALACSAKVLSYVFTYPFETCKVYSQLEKQPKNINDLYQGFGGFIVLATFQCFVNYNIFFAVIDSIKSYYPQHLTYLYSSIISCLITSVIKVPLSFVSRNIVFVKHKSGIEAVLHLLSKMNKELFQKSWLTNILSDIPDSFIKFFVNSWIHINIPSIHNFNRSCITGLITSFVNMPMDYLLTQTLCSNVSITTQDNSSLDCKDKNQFFYKCMNGIQYRLISTILGNVIFFNMFNSLQEHYRISV